MLLPPYGFGNVDGSAEQQEGEEGNWGLVDG